MITWLAGAFRAEGLDVREVPGWKTRGRPYPFYGSHGVMFHHTASSRHGGAHPSLQVVTEGRSGLPGPLCHVLVERGANPAVWVVAAGYANHAGLGGPWKTVPQDSGNRYIVGVEPENDGRGEPWHPDQLDALDRVFAAVLRYQGRDASWCVGHKEWAPDRGKINPYGIHMSSYRNRLDKFMEGDMAGEIADSYFAAVNGRGISPATFAAGQSFLRGVRLRARGNYVPNSNDLADEDFIAGWNLVFGDGQPFDYDVMADLFISKYAERIAS